MIEGLTLINCDRDDCNAQVTHPVNLLEHLISTSIGKAEKYAFKNGWIKVEGRSQCWFSKDKQLYICPKCAEVLNEYPRKNMV